MEGKADLHTHTIHSDGALTPSELVQKAHGVGLSTLAITDHDSIDGIDEAVAIGMALGVAIVPGVELSAHFNGSEVHILGYFINHRHPALLETLAVFREERLKRAERIVDKLNRMKIPITMENVLENVSGNVVGRPHIASALVSEGHANSYHHAFNKYLGDGKPAFERKPEFSVEESVRLIADCGGLAFLAHPGRSFKEDVLVQLIQSGLDGIEVVHPSHPPELVVFFRGILGQFFLLESGGSDYHGGAKGDDALLGSITIPVASVDAMRRRLLSH